MLDHYILNDDGTTEPAEMITAWRTMQARGSQIGSDTIGDVRVSTVFLTVDHGHGDGPPMVFETMVFGGTLDQEQVRYCSKAAALAGHAAMVARVKAALQ